MMLWRRPLSVGNRLLAYDRRERGMVLLPLDQLRGLPRATHETTHPGIYFMWHGPLLTYIGQSANIAIRVGQHWRTKRQTHVTWLRFDHLQARAEYEKRLIRHHRPVFNIMGLP